MSESHPIVGSHFHPPAKALLESLGTGTALQLVPEPDNPFDPNALRVSVTSETLSALPDATRTALDSALPLFGFTLAEVLARSEWQLGYIPRTAAQALAPTIHRARATWTDMHGPGGFHISGTLGFAANGQPTVTTD